MSTLEVEVSLYALHVDARETVMAVLDAGDRGAASDALSIVLEAAASGAVLSAEPSRPPALAPSRLSTVDETLDALAVTDLLSARTLWRESGTDAYLSEGRALTVVHVQRSFVPYRHDTDDRDAGSPAQRQRMSARRLPTVPAGWYLIGQVGDIVPALVGATGMDPARPGCRNIDEAAEQFTSWAVDVEGFGASRCDARCSGCARRWYAEAGSWHFLPEAGDGTDWHYDDAYGFDSGTISCPRCGSGRIGFSIS
jgi:hypothetical protein